MKTKALLLAGAVLGVTVACPLFVLTLHAAAGYGARNALEVDASAALGTGGGMGLGVQLLLAAVAGLVITLAAVLVGGYHLYTRGGISTPKPKPEKDKGRWASGPNARWRRVEAPEPSSPLDVLEQLTDGGDAPQVRSIGSGEEESILSWWRL